eukprot:Nk52_evm7s967 gene=Nk52_evmTU7s967
MGLSTCEIETAQNSSDGLFDYYRMYYCTFSGMEWLAYILLFLWTVVLFYILASTADKYFCYALHTLAEKLRLSSDVAGVTLLALGNGAPDFFTAFAGLNNDAVDMVLGANVGATCFILLFIMGMVIVTSVEKEGDEEGCTVKGCGRTGESFHKRLGVFSFTRNSVCLLLAVAALFGVVVYGEIHLWVPCAFIASYFFYVLIIVSFNYYQQSDQFKYASLCSCGDNVSLPGENNSSQSHYGTGSGGEEESCEAGFLMEPSAIGRRRAASFEDVLPSHRRRSSVFSLFDGHSEAKNSNAVMESQSIPAARSMRHSTRMSSFLSPEASARVSPSHSLETLEAGNSHHSIFPDVGSKCKGVEVEEESGEFDDFLEGNLFEWVCEGTFWKRWNDKTNLQRVCSVATSPIDLARALTIPPLQVLEGSAEDLLYWTRYCRALFVINPTTSLVFVTWAVVGVSKEISVAGTFRVPIGLVMLIIGAFLSTLLFFLTETAKPPSFRIVFLPWSFVVIIFWIYLFANELISLLQAIGYFCNISNVVLGLTVLAWGNSFGDLATDVSVARRGNVRTAIAGILSSPLFSMLLSMAVSILLTVAREGPLKFSVRFDTFPAILLSFICIICAIIGNYVVIAVNGFYLNRVHGFILVFLYVVYAAASIGWQSAV